MNRMPNVLIAMHYLEIGGAEAALIGLLKTLNPERVNVDLFLYDHRGELMADIPEWVNVLPLVPEYSMLEKSLREVLNKRFFKILFRRICAKLKAKRVYDASGSKLENYSTFFYAISESAKSLPPIRPNTEYDLAISFLTPHTIVLDKVRAKKKVGWIHTDYTKVYIDVLSEMKMWSRLDNIISISEDVTKTFCSVFPLLKSRILEIENIISPKHIRQRAALIPESKIRQELEVDNNEIVLLSIGRFCHPKKFEEIPDICRILVKRGLPVKWYIIGFGDDSLIRESIERNQMQRHVEILGKRSNPYPYIKSCDVYLQPSRYEGKSIVVREAQILGKPVIITDYPTATSQVRNEIDGFIVPMPIEECANSIYDIIVDKSRLQSVAEYNKAHDFGNESEVEKIYSLIP